MVTVHLQSFFVCVFIVYSFYVIVARGNKNAQKSYQKRS